MFESTEIIATKQYEAAKDLFDHGATEELNGPVDVRLSW